MEDLDLGIANLEVKISLLRREERHWLAVLADDSQSSTAHIMARIELRRIVAAILAATAKMKEPQNER